MMIIRRYKAFFIAELKQAMAYRVAFFTSFFAELIKIFVLFGVWTVVFQSQTMVAGFSYEMMITYLLISQTVNNIYAFKNDASRLIAQKIKKGNIVFDLLRPVNFFNARLFENIGQTVLQLLFSFVALFVFKLLIPKFALPKSFLYCFLFLISLVPGYIIMFSVSAMSGFLTFWLMNNWGIRNTRIAIIGFFSGALVPLSALPQWMQGIMNILPFKAIVYTPTMIYMGQFNMKNTLLQIAVQFLWAALMWLLASLLCSAALKRVCINGG